jgi:hypothetical protein
MLVRAVIFRLVAWSERCKEVGAGDDESRRIFEKVTELVGALILVHRGDAN